MELQGAASRLRSQCAQKEADNQRLRQMLRDREKELFCRCANELLLQRRVLAWSDYHRLFAQPLYETHLALQGRQREAQRLWIDEAQRSHERRNSRTGAEKERQERKNAALMAQVRQLREQRDEGKERLAGMETRLKRALEECQRARRQVSALQNDLELCMKRLEKSELERERAQRHLSGHLAALKKKHLDAGDTRLYEEEIRTRDSVIAHLQKTVREMNAFLREKFLLCSEKVADSKTPASLRRPAEGISSITPRSLADDCCSSERLHQSIEKLRKHLGNAVSPSTDQSCFVSHHNTPKLSATPSFVSSWTEKRHEKTDVNLQELFAQEQ